MGVCSPATLEREGAIRISQHETSVVLLSPAALLLAGVALEGTYTGVFSLIREFFAGLPEANIRGYKPGRFSFNVKGGR